VSRSVPVSTRAAVCARKLTKVYGSGQAAVRALTDVDFDFSPAAFTAIMGPSGSGKSTLMHCLAGLDRPTAGTVSIGDTVLTNLSDHRLAAFRRNHIGFLFQRYNLLPVLTARENIVLPLTIAGRRIDPRWLGQLVATVGVADRLHHRPSELSGGQQQRVAMCRALITRPSVIFADEPTGNLDSSSGAQILGLLREAVDELDQTVIMVTHDPYAASHADHVVFLADGRVVADRSGATAAEILQMMAALDPSKDR